MAAFGSARRRSRSKRRRSLFARQLRLVRSLRRTFVCQVETEGAQNRDEPASTRVKARPHARDLFLKPPVSYLSASIGLAICVCMFEISSHPFTLTKSACRYRFASHSRCGRAYAGHPSRRDLLSADDRHSAGWSFSNRRWASNSGS